MICGFCNRKHTEVPQLVAGPEGNNICIDCSESVATGIISNPNRLKEKAACSFCGIADNFPHGIAIGGKLTICLPCVLITLRTYESKTTENLIKELELIISSEVKAVNEI